MQKTIKTAGTTFGARQKYLQGLARAGHIRLALVREPDNAYDPNAIKVIAIANKPCMVGYVPREETKNLSAVMDRGAFVRAENPVVVGGAGLSYGMRFDISYTD